MQVSRLPSNAHNANPRHRTLPATPSPHCPPPPQLPPIAPQWNRARNPSSIPEAIGIYENDGGYIKTNASNQPVNLPPRASLYANAMAPPLPNKEYANQRGSNGGH
ncbi:expressed protein [Echinococcus multilocularis]|uniref:Expressed protein n=1 Tax=Echinococcus multilocularis TaxID=6211 RepID=A0A068YJX8_ECHMU|nr:expressed protein [Echinococcus multilocularis]